jgi:hypothetical protein
MGLGLVPAVDAGVDLLPHLHGWKPTRRTDPKPRPKVLLPGNMKVRNETVPIPNGVIRAPNVNHHEEYKWPVDDDRKTKPNDGDDNREEIPENMVSGADEIIFGGGGEGIIFEPPVIATLPPKEDGEELWLIRERLRRTRLDRKLGLRSSIIAPARPISPPQSIPTNPQSTKHYLDDADDWPPSDSIRLHYPPPPRRRHLALLREVQDFIETVKQASLESTSLDGDARFERFEALVDLRAEVLTWEKTIVDDTVVEWDSEGRMVGVDTEAVINILEKWRRELEEILRGV